MLEWQKIFDGSLERSLKAGATLFRREDPVESMYLVRSGQIALERPMTDGSALTLHIASEGMALAEASLFADAYVNGGAILGHGSDGIVLSRAA